MSGWTLGVACALHMGDQSVVPGVRPESCERGSLEAKQYATAEYEASLSAMMGAVEEAGLVGSAEGGYRGRGRSDASAL
eukprot:SAG22_NODE_927_length_6466_cov_3.979582_1_plen_78_part_10